MTSDKKWTSLASDNTFVGLLVTFVLSIGSALVKMLLAFLIGTGAGALVCWYYDLPLALSLIGGILVLGIALALTTDSIFD